MGCIKFEECLLMDSSRCLDNFYWSLPGIFSLKTQGTQNLDMIQNGECSKHSVTFEQISSLVIVKVFVHIPM